MRPGAVSIRSPTSRQVRIVVGFTAGGSQDPLARLMGQWLSERLGQPFIIENRPGASGNIATEAVVRATPDSHTLLLIGTPNVINAILYDKLNFSFIRDIAPIAKIINQPLVMVVSPTIPPKTVPEFIAYAKANPGKIDMASSGSGTSPHLAGECSRKWPTSTWYTCLIAARHLQLPTCSVARCSSYSPLLREMGNTNVRVGSIASF
jgi:tripartite-type tricarboxylate transporter receptor subunit TctC